MTLRSVPVDGVAARPDTDGDSGPLADERSERLLVAVAGRASLCSGHRPPRIRRNGPVRYHRCAVSSRPLENAPGKGTRLRRPAPRRGKHPFGREGVLVDEELGADVVRAAKSDGVVVLMPIERSGSRVFELEYGDHVRRARRGVRSRTSSRPSSATTPPMTRAVRQTQITRLAAVSEWAGRTNRRWIIELLVPPTPEQRSTIRTGTTSTATCGPALTAQVISQLQAGGVHPTIWEFEGFESGRSGRGTRRRGGRERSSGSCIVRSGRSDRSGSQHWLTVAAERQFVGFAVGRSHLGGAHCDVSSPARSRTKASFMPSPGPTAPWSIHLSADQSD